MKQIDFIMFVISAAGVRNASYKRVKRGHVYYVVTTTEEYAWKMYIALDWLRSGNALIQLQVGCFDPPEFYFSLPRR